MNAPELDTISAEDAPQNMKKLVGILLEHGFQVGSAEGTVGDEVEEAKITIFSTEGSLKKDTDRVLKVLQDNGAVMGLDEDDEDGPVVLGIYDPGLGLFCVCVMALDDYDLEDTDESNDG